MVIRVDSLFKSAEAGHWSKAAIGWWGATANQMVGQRHSRSHAPPPAVHEREEKHRGKEKTQKQRDILVSDETTGTGLETKLPTDDVIRKGLRWME